MRCPHCGKWFPLKISKCPKRVSRTISDRFRGVNYRYNYSKPLYKRIRKEFLSQLKVGQYFKVKDVLKALELDDMTGGDLVRIYLDSLVCWGYLEKEASGMTEEEGFYNFYRFVTIDPIPNMRCAYLGKAFFGKQKAMTFGCKFEWKKASKQNILEREY